MSENICIRCKQESNNMRKEHCFNCYRKFVWKRKEKECPRCKRVVFLHAKGLCAGCYNFVFHLERVKENNQQKYHNISNELYKKITSECLVCGFDKVVELHHLDENKENNSNENLIGLCPNHHKMIHNFKFRKEIREILLEKGINLSEDQRLDFDESSV